MSKRFFLAWTVIFVAWMVLSFAVHGVLLDAEYDRLPNLFRAGVEAQQYVGLILLAHVLMAGAFVWLYAHGVQDKPWAAQGLRFGIAVALVNEIPNYLIYFAVQPLPAALVVKQIGFDGIADVILGLLVAALFRQPAMA